MKKLLIIEVILFFSIYFIWKMFVLTISQHIVSALVVAIVFIICRLFEKSKEKIIAYYFKKSQKTSIFFYLTRYTKLIGYIPSHKKEMSINVQLGIELCRLVLQSVVVAIFLSQIVFVPINIIENSISITIGIVFYVLCCESLLILPFLMLKELKMKNIRIILK
ncbi:MAG: hypothetical protein ATN31_05170 [Candidatus Epulonipiscioides saccharophilum]|nr:MAG: hypothetical protein ATN31_05170 [Epulopiscium sp. AS2M-Bin001]